VAEHGLTFSLALQRQWEISRRYAMFGTPIGYLIDEAGIIAADVAVGAEPILALCSRAAAQTNGVRGEDRAPTRRERGHASPVRRASERGDSREESL
jgi:hypothetical protein